MENINKLKELANKIKKLSNTLEVENKNIYKYIFDFVKGEFKFNNKLTELAFKRWIKISFKPEDFTLIFGSYIDKRAIYVNVNTLKYLEDNHLYLSNENFNDYISYNGDRQSMKSIDIKIDEYLYKGKEQFINAFITYYINNKRNSFPDEEEINLGTYFILQLLKDYIENDGLLPEKEKDFSFLNY
jgi:hypothetical protein